MNRSESPTTGLVQVQSTLEFSTRPHRYIRNMLSRRGLMVLWSACVMASADDTACALQKALGKPKIRDNYVYFDAYDPMAISQRPVQSVQFNETSHSITEGQPYEGVFTLGYHLLITKSEHSFIRLSLIWMSGQAVMNQQKWHAISMLV